MFTLKIVIFLRFFSQLPVKKNEMQENSNFKKVG